MPTATVANEAIEIGVHAATRANATTVPAAIDPQAIDRLLVRPGPMASAVPVPMANGRLESIVWDPIARHANLVPRLTGRLGSLLLPAPTLPVALAPNDSFPAEPTAMRSSTRCPPNSVR